MSASEIVKMVKFHNWTNGRLLDTAARVPEDQLKEDAKLSGGSVFDTIRHILDVDWSWRMACQGQPATEALWKLEPLDTLPEVDACWRADGERLLAYVMSLDDDGLNKEVIPSWQTTSFAIRDILFHILFHAANHRSEIGWALTRLGQSPGDLEFLDFSNPPTK